MTQRGDEADYREWKQYHPRAVSCVTDNNSRPAPTTEKLRSPTARLGFEIIPLCPSRQGSVDRKPAPPRQR